VNSPNFIRRCRLVIALAISGFGLVGHALAQANYAKAVASLGIYYPNRGLFYLQDSDGSGVVSAVGITNAPASALPFTGNWTAGSTWDSIGQYDRANATWYLKYSTASSGSADIVITYAWTNNYLLPVAGDWTGKGYKSIGTYDPTNGTFALRNENDQSNYGYADITEVIQDNNGTKPPANAIPVVGDWVGDGKTRLGYFNPNLGQFFYCLTAAQTGTVRCTAEPGAIGATSYLPIVGKWQTASTVSGVGFISANLGNNNITFYNSPGSYYKDYGVFPIGLQGATPPQPVVGKWQPTQSLVAGQNTSPTTTPSWLKGAIIYELRVQSFTNANTAGAGNSPSTFKAATYQLPYLKSLGITCINVDPIQIGGDYANVQPDQFNTQLGLSADFTAFVDAAHANGMTVLCDLVTYGVDQGCPYLTGSVPLSGAWPANNPISTDGSGVPISGIGGHSYQFDWTNPALRAWYANFVGQWAQTYHFDGIRIDSEPICGSCPLLSQLKAAIGQTTSGQYPVIMPEHIFLGESETQVRRAYVYDTTEFDYLIDSSTGLLMQHGSGTDSTSDLASLVKSLPENYYTCGLDSHDNSAYTAQGKLSRFAWGLLLSPFIPRWFMGEEYNATLNATPIYNNQLDLTQAQQGSNAQFLAQVKQLIQIRKTYANIIEPTSGLFSNANIVKVTTYSGMDLPPYSMWSSGTSITVLASNTTSGPVSVVVPLSQMGMTGYPYYEVTDMLSGSTSFPTQATILAGLTFSLAQGGVIPLLVVGMNSAPVTAGVTASSGSVSEVGGTAMFTITRSGTAGNQTFNYTMGGTAVSGSDYAALSGSLTIPAGQTTGTVVLTAIDNNLADGNRTATLALSYGQYLIGSSSNATVAIIDNEQRFSWTNGSTSGTLPWSGSANWNGSTAAASGSLATVDFFTGQTLASGTLTANNDIANPFLLNVLTLGGTGATAGPSVLSLTGGTLQFISENGFAPAVNLNAMNSGTAALTCNVNNPVILSATTQFQGQGSATFNFGGELSGSGGIVKAGSSFLTLSGINNFSGAISLNAGDLIISNTGNLPVASNLTVASGAQLWFKANGTYSIGSMTLGGTGNATGISGFGGALYLELNTFTASSPIALSGGATVELTSYSSASVITLSGPISGNAPLALQSVGAASNHLGTWILGGSSSYSGSTLMTVNKCNGVLKLSGGDNRLPIGTALTLTSNYNFGSGVWSYLTFDLNGCNQSLSGLMATGTGACSVINSNAIPVTLTINGTANSVFCGVLGASGSANFSVVKAGGGVWALSATASSPYTGTTTVSSGTLALSGTLTNSIPKTSTISIQSGATLDVTGMTAGLTLGSAQLLTGAGLVVGAVTVTGTHRPGTGIGIGYFTGSLAYGPASHLTWALNGNAVSSPGINYSQVSAGAVTGSSGAVVDVVLNGSGSSVDFSNWFWTQSRAWTVISGTSVSGSFALGSATVDSKGQSAHGYGSFSVQMTSAACAVVWTPSPINAWRGTSFGTNTTNPAVAGDNANPVGDGVVNLTKYALGLDPNIASRTGQPVVSQAGGYLMLTYTKVTSATDIIYQSLWSNDLGLWQSSGITEDILLNSGTTQQVRDKIPLTGETRKFLRLQVTRP